VYADGYDLSGYTRSVGPLSESFAVEEDKVYGNELAAGLLGQVTISPGTLSSVFDNTATSGPHVVMSNFPAIRSVLVAYGIRAAPALGDPAFMGTFEQTGYVATVGQESLAVDIPFVSAGAQTSLLYDHAWGPLLHPLGAETAASTATGVDNPMAAATAFGGYMMYQVTAGNGTATLSVMDGAANVDGSFTALTSSGSIDCSTPKHGIIALARTATVKRYLRFQIAFGAATTVTFVTAFVRAYH
jgi:hypothetical protein